MPAHISPYEKGERNNFARKLREIRANRGLNKAELASRISDASRGVIHVTRHTVWKWESGRAKLTPKVLEAVARWTGSPGHELTWPADISPYSIGRLELLEPLPSMASSVRERLGDEATNAIVARRRMEFPIQRLNSFKHPCSRMIHLTRLMDEEWVSKVANRIRGNWGVGPTAPIASVEQWLEDHAVTLLHRPAADYGLRPDTAIAALAHGRTARASIMPAIVILDGDKAGGLTSRARERLTVANAFILILAHASDVYTGLAARDPAFGDRIARELLMPTEAIANQLRHRRNQVTAEAVLALECVYGLSRHAVLRRLQETGNIDFRTAGTLTRQTSDLPELMPTERSRHAAIVNWQ